MIFAIGCSNNQQTDEDLSQNEIDEMELEENENELNEEEPLEALDVKDKEAVFSFIESEFSEEYDKNSFIEWDAFYFDFNGDVNDDVAYTAVYGEGNLDKTIFITGEGGKFRVVPSNIGLAKYENTVGYQDGFITVKQKSGGHGIHFVTLSLFVYDDKEIKYTGTSLVMQDSFLGPDGYEILGDIDGKLTDFKYTSVKTDIETEEKTLLEETKYVYNEDTMTFEREVLFKEKDDIDLQESAIELSLNMTKDQIIEVLGDNYEIENEVNEMDGTKLMKMNYQELHLFSHIMKKNFLKKAFHQLL